MRLTAFQSGNKPISLTTNLISYLCAYIKRNNKILEKKERKKELTREARKETNKRKEETPKKKRQMAKRKLKVVMLGEGRVGKTSLLQRFLRNSFDEECPSTTKATMFANVKMEVCDTTVDVSIWDTAGQERFHALGPIYYRDAQGAVLAYDITDKDSFDKVKIWLKELHTVVGENIQVVIVGNKCDLERDRKVNKKEAEEWAVAHHAKHFLCSAKLGLRVTDAFQGLVANIVKAGGSEGSSSAMGGEGGGGGGMGNSVSGSSRSKRIKISDTDETSGSPAGQREKRDGCSC